MRIATNLIHHAHTTFLIIGTITRMFYPIDIVFTITSLFFHAIYSIQIKQCYDNIRLLMRGFIYDEKL